MIQEKIPFKCTSYLELWQPFVRRSVTICAILVEGIKRNNSVIFFEFGSMVQDMSFKRFLIWSSGDPPVKWSGTFFAILKEGIMGNIHSGDIV